MCYAASATKSMRARLCGWVFACARALLWLWFHCGCVFMFSIRHTWRNEWQKKSHNTLNPSAKFRAHMTPKQITKKCQWDLFCLCWAHIRCDSDQHRSHTHTNYRMTRYYWQSFVLRIVPERGYHKLLSMDLHWKLPFKCTQTHSQHVALLFICLGREKKVEFYRCMGYGAFTTQYIATLRNNPEQVKQWAES